MKFQIAELVKQKIKGRFVLCILFITNYKKCFAYKMFKYLFILNNNISYEPTNGNRFNFIKTCYYVSMIFNCLFKKFETKSYCILKFQES